MIKAKQVTREPCFEGLLDFMGLFRNTDFLCIVTLYFTEVANLRSPLCDLCRNLNLLTWSDNVLFYFFLLGNCNSLLHVLKHQLLFDAIFCGRF